MNILDELKDKITEVQTITVGMDEILVIKLRHDEVSQEEINKVHKVFEAKLPKTKVLICDDLFQFIKISQEEAKLIDLLKG